jgi:hypothetical protein
MNAAIRWRLWLLADWRRRKIEKWTMRLVWALPRYVAYWAFVRVAAHGTTGRFGTTHPDRLSVVEAMKRWDPPA